MPRTILAITLGLLIPGIAGCSRPVVETFPGHDRDAVWSALVAVAQEPDYQGLPVEDRWIVKENEVWADESTGRIEIERRLERLLYAPAGSTWRQDRTWRLRVSLDEEAQQPQATLRHHGWVVPAHLWEEADFYFNEVWAILQGPPPGPSVAEPALDAPPPPSPLPPPAPIEIPPVAEPPTPPSPEETDPLLRDLVEPG
jgi:hypothetical protein